MKPLKTKSVKTQPPKPRATSSHKSTGRADQELSPHLSHLGAAKTQYPDTYSPQVLESFPNKHPSRLPWVSLVCTEFTSLCPLTGQPDFAKIFINYIPKKKCVESKALKLYLFSFRNHGDFHEDCVQKICDDLYDLMEPQYVEVIGEFTPRGGIAIFPFSQRHDGSTEVRVLATTRKANYSPGRYGMDLSRLY